MSRVGIIGDTHEPYCLVGYREWCADVFDSWDVDTVVHIGDLIDHHALSFHDSEPELVGAHGERMDAIERLQPWYDTFPELTLINGNHDIIPARQLKRLGMAADTWLRPLRDVYEFPEGWAVEDEVYIDGVLYHHGYTSGGVNGFRTDAVNRMVSTVSGHNHSNAGVSASASDRHLAWGMAVGCGVDNTSMAFSYGKHFRRKPIVACGIVLEGLHPYVEYMQL